MCSSDLPSQPSSPSGPLPPPIEPSKPVLEAAPGCIGYSQLQRCVWMVGKNNYNNVTLVSRMFERQFAQRFVLMPVANQKYPFQAEVVVPRVGAEDKVTVNVDGSCYAGKLTAKPGDADRIPIEQVTALPKIAC